MLALFCPSKVVFYEISQGLRCFCGATKDLVRAFGQAAAVAEVGNETRFAFLVFFL